MNSYTQICTQVFNSVAGGNPKFSAEIRPYDANADKISIILNTLDSHLTFNRSRSFGNDPKFLTEDECFRQILLLALAAGDPTALCTTGNALQLHSRRDGLLSTSWLRRPREVDTDFSQRLPRAQNFTISADVSWAAEYVNLDLVFLASVQDCILFTRDSCYNARFDRGKAFIDKCFRNDITMWTRVETATAREAFANFLARIFATVLKEPKVWECFPHVSPQLETSLNLLFDENLSIKLGADWPQLQRPRAAAATVIESLTLLSTSRPSQISNFSHLQPLRIPAKGDKHLLALAPAYTNMPLSRRMLAVPRAVLNDSYKGLARCWIIQQRLEQGSKPEYILLSKSILFGSAALSRLELPGWEERADQRVLSLGKLSSSSFDFPDHNHKIER